MSNPLFNDERWNQEGSVAAAQATSVAGTIKKAGILLVILLVFFGATWDSLERTKLIFGLAVGPTLAVSAIAGLVLAVIAGFVPRAAMITGLLYAACEGVLLGGVSWMFNLKYHGLPLLAAALTIGTLVGMLFLYTQRIIRATPMFIRIVIGATVGLALGVGILWLLNAFGIATGVIQSLYGSGPIGIAFSVFCVGLAAFNLVLDFHFIEQAAANRLPKHYEWVGALGLIITLIWLYLELLRLLAKLRR